MRFKTLSEWLFWLESLQVTFSREEALSELKKIAHRLDLFPCRQPVITITGTNGKGSCAALLESIYHHAGYRVGLFTSPHLLSFNERIRVQSKNVSGELICNAFNKIDCVRGNTIFSYFHFAFLAALLIFKTSELDVLVFEVGIGGRYDAVNILDADLAIITNIALDHCELLGETREEIVFEKAGILRDGIPVICGEASPPTPLLEEVKCKRARLYCLDRDFSYQLAGSETGSWHCGKASLTGLPKSSILPNNTAVVLTAIHCLQSKFSVSYQAIYRGLRQVFLPGRLQLVKMDGISVLFDVAHNPAAVEVLKKTIQSMPIKGRQYAIVSIRQEKDIPGILRSFSAEIDEWALVDLPHKKMEKAKKLSEELETLGIESRECYSEPKQAFQSVLKKAKKGDMVIVFGSFLTVSGLLEYSLMRG